MRNCPIQHTCLYLTSSCGRHGAFGLPLDIDRHLIDARIAFTSLSFSFFSDSKKKKALCQAGGFQKRSNCHFRTGRRRFEIHIVSQLLAILTHNQPGAALPEASACVDVPDAVTCSVKSRCTVARRASQSIVQANSKSAICDFFYSKRSLPTHPTFGMHYVYKEMANL